MEPIHGLERLVRLMRLQPSNKKTSIETSSEQIQAPRPRNSPAELERELRIKLKQLEKSGARPVVVERFVIEAVLTWEHGERLHNEPKFASLIHQVHSRIEEDPSLQMAFKQFVKQLSR